jgi:hypothetical protein
MRIYLTVVIIAFFGIRFYAQSTDLFLNDSVLKVNIHYHARKVLSDRSNEKTYHDALLELVSSTGQNSTFKTGMRTRGIFRLKSSNCYFPPFTLKFNKNEIKNTVFKGYPKLKLVFPCRKSDAYEQYILLEYLAYKIYNLLTEYSFRVRLLKIKLIDLDSKEPVHEKYGFVIEPIDKLAKRTNSKEIEVKNLHPDITDSLLINRLSIFQYMIGNTDWSVKALHNIKLLSRDSLRSPVAVPYDFDFSGLVDAPYAAPAEHLNISSVRMRYFNGYCREMEDILINVNLFISKKKTIYDLIYTVEGLEKHYIDETIKYFDQFYNILDDHNRIRKEFIDKCRKD